MHEIAADDVANVRAKGPRARDDQVVLVHQVVHAVHLVVEREVGEPSLILHAWSNDMETWADAFFHRRPALVVARSAGCVYIGRLPALGSRLCAHIRQRRDTYDKSSTVVFNMVGWYLPSVFPCLGGHYCNLS